MAKEYLTRKNLVLHLEFSDKNELEMALLKVLQEVKAGVNYNREMHNSSICEWSCLKVDSMDYREEEINGKLCQVYQSKINKK